MDHLTQNEISDVFHRPGFWEYKGGGWYRLNDPLLMEGTLETCRIETQIIDLINQIERRGFKGNAELN